MNFLLVLIFIVGLLCWKDRKAPISSKFRIIKCHRNIVEQRENDMEINPQGQYKNKPIIDREFRSVW